MQYNPGKRVLSTPLLYSDINPTSVLVLSCILGLLAILKYINFFFIFQDPNHLITFYPRHPIIVLQFHYV